MKYRNKQSLALTLFSTLIVFCIGLYLQTKQILNIDVSLLMHTCERMLAGGIYGRDFYESNPPLILYIYAPAVIFAKLIASSFVIPIKTYVSILIILSLVSCYFLIEKISTSQPNDYKSFILLPATALVLTILPGSEFGQREHIMLILVLPFCYVTALRLLKEPLASRDATIAGIMAGIGFCIKPHFFIAFFLLLMFTRKLHKEICIVLIMPIMYFLIIAVFHQTYLTHIVPLALNYYYPTFNDNLEPWTHPAVYGVLATAIIYLVSFFSIKNKSVENIFFILMIGFLIAYFSQKTNWNYHLYPAIAFETLLIFQMVWRYSCIAKSLISLNNPYYLCGAMTLVIVSICLFRYPTSYTQYKHNNIDSEIKMINHLASFKAGTSVYFLLKPSYLYPAIDYLPIKNNQITQNFWFFPGIVSNSSKIESIGGQCLKKIIVNDILKNKPDIIVSNNLLSINKKSGDLLGFLNTDKKFHELMQNYRVIDVYDSIAIYQYTKH